MTRYLIPFNTSIHLFDSAQQTPVLFFLAIPVERGEINVHGQPSWHRGFTAEFLQPVDQYER